MRSFGIILGPFGVGRHTFVKERATRPYVSVKFRPNRFLFAGIIPKSNFVRKQYIYIAHTRKNNLSRADIIHFQA